MFSLGFNRSDAAKVAWTFLEAAAAFAALQAAQGHNVNEKAVYVGAIAAGISAVKNAVLADGPVKG